MNRSKVHVYTYIDIRVYGACRTANLAMLTLNIYANNTMADHGISEAARKTQTPPE